MGLEHCRRGRIRAPYQQAKRWQKALPCPHLWVTEKEKIEGTNEYLCVCVGCKEEFILERKVPT